jgi:FkbM family methyltransferase
MNKPTGIFFNNFSTSYIPEILQELYRQRVYAPYIEQKKDQIILDIGANVGLFSFYAYPFASKIYAVEPAQEHVDVANYMLKHNNMDDKVSVHRLAISNTEGDLTLNHNTNVTMFSLSELVADKSLPTETVRAVTLNTFLEENNIEHVDFAKIDIEGIESEVICGKGFEEASKKIDSLVVEWHSWGSRNPAQLVTTLSDYGYKVKSIPSDATLFGATKL